LSISVVLNDFTIRGELGFFGKLNLVSSVFTFCFSLLYIIFRFKKGKKIVDLTIDDHGLIFFAGIFNRRIHWKDIKCVDCLEQKVIFFTWQDEYLDNKIRSDKFLRNYYNKLFLKNYFQINLDTYRNGDLIPSAMQQFFFAT